MADTETKDGSHQEPKKKQPPPIPSKPAVGVKPETLPKPTSPTPTPRPRKPPVPSKPSPTKKPQEKPPVPAKSVRAKAAVETEVSQVDNANEVKEQAKTFLIGQLAKVTGGATSKDQDNNDISNFSFQWEKTTDEVQCLDNGNKHEVIPEEGKLEAAAHQSTEKKPRKRSSNSTGILATFRSKFGSSKDKEDKEEKKKTKERKKSDDRRESSDSKSKFYVSDKDDKKENPMKRSNSSRFYVSSEDINSANEDSAGQKQDTELSKSSTESTDTSSDPAQTPSDPEQGKTPSPELPPKSVKRKSYHEQLVEKGLTPMEIDINEKPKPAIPVRRKKKTGDIGSDFSSTESLLESDTSEASKGTKYSESPVKEVASPDQSVKSEETEKEAAAERDEEKDELKSIRRTEKKRNVNNKDVFKSFTTEDMDIFHPTKSREFDDDDPRIENSPRHRGSAGSGGGGSSTAPVSLRGRDPLRAVKAERRRSNSVGAAPGGRMFGVQLRNVAKPKDFSPPASGFFVPPETVERPVQKPPPPPPHGRPRQQPPPPPPHGPRVGSKAGAGTGAGAGAKSPGEGAREVSATNDKHNKHDKDNKDNKEKTPSSDPKPDVLRKPESGPAVNPRLQNLSTPSPPIRRSKIKVLKPDSETQALDHRDQGKEQEKDTAEQEKDSTEHTGEAGFVGTGETVEDTRPESENIYDNNLEGGVPIDSVYEDVPNSPEDLYEDIEFPQSEGKTEEGKTSHEVEPEAEKKTVAKDTVSEDTVAKDTDAKDTDAKDTDAKDAVGSESTRAEQSKDSRASGKRLSLEIPKPKVSRKVSRKVSLKLTRKLTQRVKERNLDQSIVKQFLREESLDFEDDDPARDAAAAAAAEEEKLEFSDSDSDFSSDDESDESDIEWEQEIMAKWEKKLMQTKEKEEKEDPSSPEEKLRKIAQELLDTEKAYVERLHLVDQVFHFRVVMENRNHHMFPDEVLPQMFSNIKSIYQFHHDFLLPKLQERMEKWEEHRRIGDMMRKFAPFLKLYSEYVKNYGHAMATVDAWQVKSPRFHALMAEIHAMPECGKLSLQHHMLEPIQRVPRYELLLKAYLKHLPEESNDLQDTQAALDLVSTAAIHNNEAMAKSDKFRKMLEINESLGGGIDLTSPTRELVKEGKIIKVSPRNGVQDRYIFLFNDMLLVCQTMSSITLKTQYRVRNKLDMEGMQVLEGDNLELPNTFYIKSKKKTIELHCPVFEEKVEWQIALWNVIQDFVKKQMSRNIALAQLSENEEDLGKQAPKWIKDTETTMCMICSNSFTTFRRRHHCRACGIVVCGKCSTHKAYLSFTDDREKSRVCDKCHVTLMERGDISAPTLVPGGAGAVGGSRKRGILQRKATEKGVISGYLQMTSDKKNWMKRYFVVHDDFVLYSYKAHQDVVAMTSMPLPGYIVSEADDKDQIDRTMVFKLDHQQQKTYYFQCENDKSVMKRWLHVLQCVTHAELPEDVGRSPSSSAMSIPPILAAPTSPGLQPDIV